MAIRFELCTSITLTIVHYVTVPYNVTSQLATFTWGSVHFWTLHVSLSLFSYSKNSKCHSFMSVPTHKSTPRETTHSSCHLLSDVCHYQCQHNFHVQLDFVSVELQQLKKTDSQTKSCIYPLNLLIMEVFQSVLFVTTNTVHLFIN